MRKILFLDFDGVLHTDTDTRQFSRIALLDSWLARMEDVEIVISSSWREAYPIESLKKIFPAPLRERIIGATPILENGYAKGGRQREIEAYLAATSLHHANAAWIALDDNAAFFDAGCPFLVLVDPARAFGDEEGRKLLAWHTAAAALR
jgi:hypothetical protein